MSPSEVKTVAESLLASEDNSKWHFEIGIPERDKKRPKEWNIVVRWTYPDGTPLDGPSIIIVDDTTGEARFF